MTSEELVEGLEISLPGEAAAAGVDFNEAYSKIFSSFLIASQQQHASLSHADREFIDARMRAPVKSGVMRTAGFAEDDYDTVAQDPVALNRMRANYYSTI